MPTIQSKKLSQLTNSFFSFIHVCFSKYDIVFAVNSANGPLGLLTKIFRKKSCINTDGLEWLRPKWKGIGAIYFNIASKLSTLFFDKIITDSDEMRNVYIKKYKTDSEIICYGPTIVESNHKKLINYDLKKDSYYLIVGRLIPDNNGLLIVKGFLNSKTKRKLVIVGDVPYKDKYAESFKKINDPRIIFTGYIVDPAELSALYSNCYVYIHGHEYGGTNPTMINALSINSFILALSTKFNKEMLENYNNFLLFDKDINSISNTINTIDNSVNKQSSYSLPKKYLWENIVDKYEAVFYSLLNK